MGTGFTDEGLAALDTMLAGHVSRGTVPGLVALVARGGQVHVTTAGHRALGDSEPIGRDAIFRIASLSKPIAGAAAMALIEDGAMALSDPVTRWLPELADRRVLRTLASDLADTVPADRPVTVEDALAFRLGFGLFFPPGGPVAEAEAALHLNTLGPPWPPTPLTPDEWIAGLGSLPLLDQPGERWRYNTGATVAGILISRVAGAPLDVVLRERVFEPLGMADTAMSVPAAKLDRFTAMYAPGASGGLDLVDAPGGWYATPPAMPDAAYRLVSTVDDLWAFAAMLAADGGGLLAPESVREMLRDRTTKRDRAENPWFFGDHDGWGLMMSAPAADAPPRAGTAPPDGRPYGYGWDGGSGTTWRTDPVTGLTGILLTQRMMTSPEPPEAVRDFWSAAYAAIAW